MFARLLIYDNVDLALLEKALAWMKLAHAGPFREAPGYRGSMRLVDRDNARMVQIEFHATAGHASEANTLARTLCRQLRGDLPRRFQHAVDIAPDSVGVYEILDRD